MLVRSGLRCHCCFKLRHECERRKADTVLASYMTFSCKCPLSLAPFLNCLICPGSPGPGKWWFEFEPPYGRHSILAMPRNFSQGYTCVKCEVGTGKVVSTPGGSPASISSSSRPEHGHSRQASQVRQDNRSPPGQLGPHVCLNAVRPLAAIAYAQPTARTWEPVFDSRQNFKTEPCRRQVRTRRGTRRWMTSRLYHWCPSPRSRCHQWTGGRRRPRSTSNPMKSQNRQPRSSGSPLMGQQARGFQDRQAPPREIIPLGVQQCGGGRKSLLDFMVARTPSSELSRHRLAVSALWIFATVRAVYGRVCWPLLPLASVIRLYTTPDQVPPGRATTMHPSGNVVSTPARPWYLARRQNGSLRDGSPLT